MPSRRRAVSAALLAIAVLALSSACAARRGAASPAPGHTADHPDLGAAGQQGAACADCHAGVTPAIVKEWDAGPHGLNLVRCVVCHGSTGNDFVASPGPQRCDGCHAVQVASVTPAKRQPLRCDSCHAPHRLDASGKPNPHRTMKRP